MNDRPKKPRMILGRDWIAALIEAGVVPERTFEIVIRAKVDEPVILKYRLYGDERLLEVRPQDHGIPVSETLP